ncbi:hypothetical protein GGF46_003296 [Coemansia sp. RSA 552]|nr:hypothetical protein GGF46_003296 [Coemansia sp. RSA 552]
MANSGHKIKVVCRVRPFLKTETPDEARHTLEEDFDSCYGASTGQDVIYRSDVRPLVETVFSGLSATVFCYGVTGAGKTHTIQGTEEEPGIIPRALEHIFMHQERDAYDYDIRISYYEIYKEAVFDLLKPQESGAGLSIREDANRRIFVAGLSEKTVTSYEQFDMLYQKACRNRRTASTKLNNHSSRSHAILTVQVQWKDDVGAGKVWSGRLHLIDLAGSEDNRRTENGRDRMAESSAINRSLFVLGQVVEALNAGASRIPYRDSKMTRILQDSLGGESLGMMIVNVAPGEFFLQDTHNTLSFATKSREVVNKPVAHEVVEQRWSVVDRLQHHRGAGLPSRSTVVSSTAPGGFAGTKRRRSDEPAASDGSPENDGHSVSIRGSGGLAAARRRAIPAGRHSDTGMLGSTAQQQQQPGLRRTASAAPRQADLVQKVVKARFDEMEHRSETASNEILERVLRIEKQLSSKQQPGSQQQQQPQQLDSNIVVDLFTPATKLKTSRGWLKYARELEQKGDLERALVHYEEALRYAPELNKLETHIAKLRARVRRQKRRSSIASHGSANIRVSDQGPQSKLPNGAMLVGGGESSDEDVGPLWMRDGLAESPGAEKAQRRSKPKPAAARNSAMPVPRLAPGDVKAQAGKPVVKRRRVLGDSGLANPAVRKKYASVTEGSVHDRRISFGGAQLNPFVVGGSDFNTDLQRRLDDRKPSGRVLCTKKLVAKSSAAARLQRALIEPPTPADDRRKDRDFVPDEASDSSADGADALSNGRAKPRVRRGRVPGSLSVRNMMEQRQQQQQQRAESENIANGNSADRQKDKPKDKPASKPQKALPEKLDLGQFNDISIASALQMINSAEVKKIMKLQGIGKRRAEQIQQSVQDQGPLRNVSELQTRLQFKNKIIMGILSTFA